MGNVGTHPAFIPPTTAEHPRAHLFQEHTLAFGVLLGKDTTYLHLSESSDTLMGCSLFSVPTPLCSCVDHCTNPTQRDSDADSAMCHVALGLVMALFSCAGDCTSLSMCRCILNHRSVGRKGPLVQPSSWKGTINTCGLLPHEIHTHTGVQEVLGSSGRNA